MTGPMHQMFSITAVASELADSAKWDACYLVPLISDDAVTEGMRGTCVLYPCLMHSW